MKARHFVKAVFVFLAVTLVGCGTKQLSDFKQKLTSHDYAGIAQQPVSCEEVDDVCGQLHLIKGDACFRLAKQNSDPAKNYPCAVTELDKGIQFTKTWQQGEVNLNCSQTYANLCESLREWQDRESGTGAAQLTQRLLDTSRRFLAAEPGDPAAVYYNASARYTQLRPEILHPRDPQSLCRQLRAIMSDLDAVMPRASGTDYQTSITRLQTDINGARRTVAGCS